MVPDLKTFTNKVCKIAAHFFFVFGQILPYWVFLTPVNCLLPPTSRSPMWSLFRFSESLGKSNGRKWSQIWKLLLIKGVKSQRQKIRSFLQFFFFIGWHCLNVFCPPLPEVQCPNFLDFWNPWGKVMERNGLRFENFCSYGVKLSHKKLFISWIMPY